MDNYIGEWINTERIPTLEDVVDTYRAVKEQPTEFDFTTSLVLKMGAEKLNISEIDLAEEIFLAA